MGVCCSRDNHNNHSHNNNNDNNSNSRGSASPPLSASGRLFLFERARLGGHRVGVARGGHSRRFQPGQDTFALARLRPNCRRRAHANRSLARLAAGGCLGRLTRIRAEPGCLSQSAAKVTAPLAQPLETDPSCLGCRRRCRRLRRRSPRSRRGVCSSCRRRLKARSFSPNLEPRRRLSSSCLPPLLLLHR